MIKRVNLQKKKSLDNLFVINLLNKLT